MKILFLIASFTIFFSPQTTDKYQTIRTEMVNDQIVKRGIRNPLTLKAMEKVPRHLFVPPELMDRAYEDILFPLDMIRLFLNPLLLPI